MVFQVSYVTHVECRSNSSNKKWYEIVGEEKQSCPYCDEELFQDNVKIISQTTKEINIYTLTGEIQVWTTTDDI